MNRRETQALVSPASRPRSGFAEAATVMGTFIGVLWAIQIADSLTHYSLLRFGIFPRSPGRIEDIVSAPFIHVSYAHLESNTLPLLVLGFLVALGGIGRFLSVTGVIILVSGLGVWLTSPSGTDTVGASGVIFGYLGYLVLRGILERRLLDLMISIVVGVLYWSILPDVLPGHPGVSWEAHLFGLLGGVLAAYVFHKRDDAGAKNAKPTPPAGSPNPRTA